MKKIFLCLILFTVYSVAPITDVAFAAEPQHAKWGKLAMEKTKEKYPNAEIKDYKHIGRVDGINTNMEKFKLWLKEAEKEYGVLVHIEYDKKTEKVIDITFKEVEK